LQVSCQKPILAGFKTAEIIGFSQIKQAKKLADDELETLFGTS
jgi:hypothetical protein